MAFKNIVCVLREKDKLKEREEAWMKIDELARRNPDVSIKTRHQGSCPRLFVKTALTVRKWVNPENCFKDLKFDGTSVSTTGFRQRNFVYY